MIRDVNRRHALYCERLPPNNRRLISYFYVDSKNYLPEGNNVCLRVNQKIISRATARDIIFCLTRKPHYFPREIILLSTYK